MLSAKGWCRQTLAARCNSQGQCQPGLYSKCAERGDPVVLFICDARNVCCPPPEHSSHIETVLQDGWTPLHFASYWGSLKVLRYLLNSGVHVNAQDKVPCRTAYLVAYARRCRPAKSWPLQDSSRHCVPDCWVLKLPSATAAWLHHVALGMSRAVANICCAIMAGGPHSQQLMPLFGLDTQQCAFLVTLYAGTC